MSYKTLCASTITLPLRPRNILPWWFADRNTSAVSETADLIDWDPYGNDLNLNKISPN